MKTTQTLLEDYLTYCHSQKRLDDKTLKAYRIDLRQFCEETGFAPAASITPEMIESTVAKFHQQYKPKTVKRKIASIKAFFHYLEYKDFIEKNPFNKLQFRFRESFTLPKTIPLRTVEQLLSTMYREMAHAATPRRKKILLRDIAAIELLFATGMRISELCSLRICDVNLYERNILIYGKGSKERTIQIGNEDVLHLMIEYRNTYINEMNMSNHFFVSPSGRPLSDQAVRRMINKYTEKAAIDLHITPHMFRHTFATCLLEADVDIRYIQEMLGHSSINITEIYTHVTTAKQRDILTSKHPRNGFCL